MQKSSFESSFAITQRQNEVTRSRVDLKTEDRIWDTDRRDGGAANFVERRMLESAAAWMVWYQPIIRLRDTVQRKGEHG